MYMASKWLLYIVRVYYDVYTAGNANTIFTIKKKKKKQIKLSYNIRNTCFNCTFIEKKMKFFIKTSRFKRIKTHPISGIIVIIIRYDINLVYR